MSSTAGALYKKILSGTRVVWFSYFDSGWFCGKFESRMGQGSLVFLRPFSYIAMSRAHETNDDFPQPRLNLEV